MRLRGALGRPQALHVEFWMLVLGGLCGSWRSEEVWMLGCCHLILILGEGIG